MYELLRAVKLLDALSLLHKSSDSDGLKKVPRVDDRFLPGSKWRVEGFDTGRMKMSPGHLTIVKRNPDKTFSTRYVPDDASQFSGHGWGGLEDGDAAYIEAIGQHIPQGSSDRYDNLFEVHKAGWIPPPLRSRVK